MTGGDYSRQDFIQGGLCGIVGPITVVFLAVAALGLLPVGIRWSHLAGWEALSLYVSFGALLIRAADPAALACARR